MIQRRDESHKKLTLTETGQARKLTQEKKRPTDKKKTNDKKITRKNEYRMSGKE